MDILQLLNLEQQVDLEESAPLPNLEQPLHNATKWKWMKQKSRTQAVLLQRSQIFRRILNNSWRRYCRLIWPYRDDQRPSLTMLQPFILKYINHQEICTLVLELHATRLNSECLLAQSAAQCTKYTNILK